ncbi:MAG TPA: hypothetical protein H9700_13630, partial [Candidatus Eisenbergiella intestinipullorum]|nr:hypothetical protein [Candidatus Eisenbergiella intestinipullorum]
PVFTVLGSFPPSFRISETVPLNNSFWNFQGCITVYLSRYFLLLTEALRPSSGHPALSDLRAFLSRNGDYLITGCFLSQALFSTFLFC